MIYLASKVVTLVFALLLIRWFLEPPRSLTLTVISFLCFSALVRNAVWFVDTVFDLGRPDWLYFGVVWFESLCFVAAFLVLKFWPAKGGS